MLFVLSKWRTPCVCLAVLFASLLVHDKAWAQSVGRITIKAAQSSSVRPVAYDRVKCEQISEARVKKRIDDKTYRKALTDGTLKDCTILRQVESYCVNPLKATGARPPAEHFEAVLLAIEAKATSAPAEDLCPTDDAIEIARAP